MDAKIGGKRPYDRSVESSTFITGADALAELRAAVVAHIERAVDDAGADGVVVGLSGGIDSTLTAFLAAEALGGDRVLGITLPSRKGHRPDATDAKTIADGIGIEFAEIPLWRTVEAFESAISDATGVEGDTVVGGNLVARLRMAALYYVANARSRLVVGTANRSELLTGYFTKYGDGAADLYPTGDLYKTEVRALAQHVGLPRRIVAKESTAGFWSGQTDESELGAPYETIDALFVRVLDGGASVEAAADELDVDRAMAEELLARYVDTQHKRTTPPIHAVGGRRSPSRPIPGRVTEAIADVDADAD
ncbi:NAD+ synthase [Halomicrobium zhouii]|uniref:NH(3)-dependent NAD(+) synthetase n=1 Tax=Halomicrobium zhouii TaxID=767519 RepID=A0A1I6KE63_9EURY|nr:NAD+ synthase [Halomicrobium zhouii]SFR89513.1 NAD+ synthase [Halomicrobium zhouii]